MSRFMFVIILKVFYGLFLTVLFFLDLLTLALGPLLVHFLLLNGELIYCRKLFTALGEAVDLFSLNTVGSF